MINMPLEWTGVKPVMIIVFQHIDILEKVELVFFKAKGQLHCSCADKNGLTPNCNMGLHEMGHALAYVNFITQTEEDKHFKKEFKNTTGESWYALQNGYRVKFLQNGVYNMAHYNEKGRWLRTIRYYDETGLPKNIRNAVRHEFLDFNIFLVMEMNLPQSTIYLVKIEDKTSWKTVRVAGDEIEVVENFTK